MYLDKIDSPMSISMRSRIGITKPAYCTGIGKILLAYLDEEQLKQVLGNTRLERHTKNTITNKRTLYRKLKQYRKQGFALDEEEIEEGLFCVAAPILGIDKKVIAAVSVSLPAYRAEGKLTN